MNDKAFEDASRYLKAEGLMKVTKKVRKALNLSDGEMARFVSLATPDVWDHWASMAGVKAPSQRTREMVTLIWSKRAGTWTRQKS